MVVCRGCCCGTARKHPGIDHDGHLDLLRQTRDHNGRKVPVLISTCLGPCAEGNIVVVHPSDAGRRWGARPLWLGLLNDDKAIDLLAGWAADGGPGVAPIPAALAFHSIQPAGPQGTRR
ncbi:MAG: hypothetical protein JWL97_4265 [Gemmatimonadales bacterium]|nr:hypothetical protein [Gemmatimonadales bacterium]